MGLSMVLVALLAGLVLPSSALGQSGPSSFTLTASANGVTTAVVAPNLSVVDTLVELGGSVAQAEVSSLGISQAFAANPTPGELVLTGPGLIAGLSGLPIPNEQFPTTVASTHPAQPEQTSGVPPSTLEARSEARRSEARAVTGLSDVSSAQSTATVEVGDNGTSRAEASVLAGPIVVGPVVIGEVRSLARSVVGADGQVDVVTDLQVGAVVLDGQAARVTPDGLELAGTELPLPAADSPEELAAQGLEIRTMDGQQDPEAGTATSPAVEITIRQVLAEGIPGVVPPGQQVILRYVVGRATVGAAAVTPPAPQNRVPDPVSPPASSETSEAPTSAPAMSSPADPPQVPSAVAPAPTTGAPVADPQVADAQAAPAAPGGPETVAARLVSAPLDSLLFYPVLVVAALAALASVQAVRTSGRRRLWEQMNRDLT